MHFVLFYRFCPLYFISNLIVSWSEKMPDTISVFLNLLRLDLPSSVWSIMENIPCALEKKVSSVVLMYYKYQLILSHLMCHLRFVFSY